MATLEQLDSWGSIDALDVYGTLEQLDNLTLHEASATASVSASVSASATRIQVASDTAGATPVTNREYEERLQDERRKVRLLSRSLLPNFIEEYEQLIKA